MKLTNNFNLNEFTCKCGCKMPESVENNVKDLAESLQHLRDKIKESITITNAYRCEKHNALVGGVPNSQHLKGKAADIKVKSLTPEEVADEVDELMLAGLFDMGGIGKYNSFTHVDIRGRKARWDYR